MKKCKRCGSELSKQAVYCPKCGFKVPDNSWIVILLIVFGSVAFTIVAIIASVFLVVKSTLNKYTNMEYITLDTYKVPNVFYDSDYSVCNFDIHQSGLGNNREIIDQFRSCKKFTNKDIDKYVEKLYEDDFFEEIYEGKKFYIKEVDDNFIIVVYFYNGDTVAYMYQQDSTDLYKTNRNVRI